MTKTVIGIRFKKAGKIYYFDPLGIEIQQYDHVVVETVQGLEYGEVAIGPREIDTARFPFPVKPIVRKSTAKDDDDYKKLREKEIAARAVFDEKVQRRGMVMRLINIEYTFDKRKAVFYFTAEGRVDFRELVKDLASALHVRIELRQVGIRDEAKLFRTLGCCGRNTCCSEWLGDFIPVSIKMAKEQNLSLNATKISGVCGRLLCCLTYENEFYKNISKRMPKTGQMVETPDGVGQVYRLDILRENVIVKITNDRDEVEIKTYGLADIASSDSPKPIAAPKRERTDPRKEGFKKAVKEAVEIQKNDRASEKAETGTKGKKNDRGHQPRKNRRAGEQKTSQTQKRSNTKRQQRDQTEEKTKEKLQNSRKAESKNVEQKKDQKKDQQNKVKNNSGRRRNGRRANKKPTQEG